MNMTKTLKIEIELSNDKKLTLSLAAPKDGLTRAAVEAALKDVVDKKLLIGKSAYPTGIGRIYTESVDDAEIA